MADQMQCPHCGQVYQLTSEQVPQYAGQTITCTRCGKPFTAQPGGQPQTPPLPPQPPQPGFGPTPSVEYATPPPAAQKTDGVSVASLVFGVLGLIVPLIPGVIAVILGIIGIRRTKDPLVGGRGLAIAGLSVGAASIVLSVCMTSMLISILLPSLNRARETANRVKCASNMRQIGQAIVLYSNANGGEYPDSLETLLISQPALKPVVYTCPTTNDTPAPGATPQAQAQTLSVPGHLSYVYVGKDLNVRSPGDAVLLYEPLTNHDDDGTNVLYADGSVQFIMKAQAEPMIKQVEAGENPPKP